ncbi:MAG: PAS domain S-box protein, partial [Desulfamplus sp.]|nr:PAS domain S-box protein [Desulfamplus sp.]
KSIRDFFEYQLSTSLKTVRGLSGHKEIKQALTESNQVALNDASLILDNFNTTFEATVSYLMDHEGNTIASSNRNDPDSFIGKNYSFRPYFTKALEGNPSVYMALGVTSAKRGIYFSHAVYRDGQESPAGVVVMKVSVDAMIKEFWPLQTDSPYMITFITGPQGVIFISSVDTYLFQLLEKKSDQAMADIIKSRQFGTTPLKWSGLEKRGEDRIVDRLGNEYIIFSEKIVSMPDWQVVHLHNVKEISKDIYTPLAGNLGWIIAALSIFIGLSVTILYKMAQKDILRRTAAEKELLKSEKRYRSIFQNRLIVMMVIDPETGQIEDANPAATEFYGWSLDSITGMNINDINTQPPEEILKAMETAKSNSRSIFQFQHRLRDGTIRDVEVDSGPIQYGNKTLLFSIIQDITIRKKAEIALQKSEEKYRVLFESSKDANYISTIDGKLVAANSSFLDIFGYTKDELHDLRTQDLYVNPDDRSKFVKEMEKRGFLKDFEEKLKHKNGNEIDCQLTVTFDQSVDGIINGYQGSIRDITNIKQRQLEREKLIADLQDALAEVKTLNGLLPICSHCKKIRNDQGYWEQIEIYIRDRSDAEFSHSICQACAKKYYPDIDVYDD